MGSQPDRSSTTKRAIIVIPGIERKERGFRGRVLTEIMTTVVQDRNLELGEFFAPAARFRRGVVLLDEIQEVVGTGQARRAGADEEHVDGHDFTCGGHRVPPAPATGRRLC